MGWEAKPPRFTSRRFDDDLGIRPVPHVTPNKGLARMCALHRFSLADGLSYDRLEFRDSKAGTQIAIAQVGEIIATVKDIAADFIDSADFR